MAKFEWQTEEDIVWDELPPAPPEPPARRRHWWLLVGLAALLLAAGFVIYRQVQQRIETATQTVQADVLSSHNLMLRAASEQDEELFTSLLSGRDMQWVAGETALFKQAMLLDRAPFGLEAIPFTPQTAVNAATTPDEIPSDAARITLSPDLTEAEITIMQPYLSVNKTEGTVLLAQTAVYRLGTSRWLLAPPQPEFWGDWHTADSDLLTITYPQRDEAIAQRLAEDLNTILQEACSQLDAFTCLSGVPLHIELKLSDDPNTLAATQQLTQLEADGNHWQIELPAPTLVGVPVDTVGYQILRDGYAGQILTAVLLYQANWQCCDGQAFAEAIITHQLHQLGLRPWPVTQADYQFIVDEAVTIAHFTPYWRNATFEIQTPRVDKKYIYPFIEFILFNTPEKSPQQLLQALSGNRSLISWLYSTIPSTDLFDGGSRANILDRLWSQFAYTQSLVAAVPPPIPLPEQTLTTMCVALQQDSTQHISMQQYDFAAETWSVIEEWENYTLMMPLPSSDGVLLQQFDFAANAPMTMVWQNGRLSTLYANPDNPLITFGQTDPTGQTLLAFQFDPENERADFVALPQDCANRCTPQLLSGQPVWSPDGQHALFVQQETLQFSELRFPNRIDIYDNNTMLSSGTQISLGDANGQTLTNLGNGMAPFWLDNSTFGFIYLDPVSSDSRRRNIVLATLDDPTLQTLVAAEAFTSTLPDRRPASQIHLRYVLPHPTNPDLLLVVGFDAITSEGHVWSYRQSTADIQPLTSLGVDFGYSISMSPNGRWLLLQGVERQGRSVGQTISLYNLETGETRRHVMAFPQLAPAFTYDWTSDGEWLAYVVNGQMMGLTAVNHNYTQIIPAPSHDCAAIAWVNQ